MNINTDAKAPISDDVAFDNLVAIDTLNLIPLHDFPEHLGWLRDFGFFRVISRALAGY